jgi:CheY-like chemotaxis protein/HPt (histidine-containing phosphotransfer) domain-containing protein
LLQLARLGHQADLVSNGVEAVTAVRRRPYDVVLMDVRMPELDGPAATRLIHAELGDRSPWIIAVTADALPGTRDACMAAGMDDHLTKPLVAADLARALARAGDRPERDGTADATTVASRSDGSPVLDPAALDDLRELVGGDPSTLSGLVADFLAETPTLVHELRDAVAVADPERASRAAHTLKGLGATFGATAMAQLCQRAETDGSAEETVAAIAAEHDRVALALRRLVAPDSGKPLSCNVVA